MAISERLIQLTLRARDFLSRDVQPASDSVKELTEESKRLKTALNDAGTARSLARTLRDNEQAADGLERSWKDAAATLDDLTREYGENERATAGQRIALREAKQAADAAERAYKRNQSAIKNTASELNKLGVDTKSIVAEEQRLTNELDDGKRALEANRDAIKQKRIEEKSAADVAKDHASRVSAAREAMGAGVRQVLAFAAAYVSLSAAFGLVQQGLNLVRDGIYSMLETGDKFELLDKRMASLMGSVAGGEQATAWIKQFAKDTPLEVADVTEAFALLKSYGLDPMDGALQAVVDKNEQLGGGMERLSGIASALGQAFAKQKLQTEEILQLVERGVPVWSMLEKITGKNAAQLSKLATEGRLGRDVIKALVDEIGKSADGAAAEGMNTLTGKVSNLKDVWADFQDRVAKSGALDFAKKKLGEVANTIDQMDKDGRLDKLAEALSNAFVQGAGKVEEFAKKLLDVDFNKLTDDSTGWLNTFGTKIDTMTASVSAFVLPFRALFNGLTSGLSGIAAAYTGTMGLMLGAVEAVADKIPDMLGGAKLKASVSGAREVLNGLRDGFVAQIEQDGKDLDSAWEAANGNMTASTEAATQQQTAAVKTALNQQQMLNQAHVDNLVANQQRAVDAAAAGKIAITDMANAIQLIDTTKTTQQVEGLRTALFKAYQDGKISLDQYQQASGLLSEKLKALGGAAGGAADLVSDLDEKLGDLAQVQSAISNAKTDIDINKIKAALGKLYDEGTITAAQYNEELKKASDQQKELKKAVTDGKKAQDDKNKTDQEAIVTSEQLRRESGKRMEEERKAGDQAMQDRRNGAEDAKRDMADMEGFFGGVLTRAREPLAAMSAAALEAFDKLSGISTVDLSLDTGSLEETTASLQKATTALGQMQAAANTVGMSSLGTWMTDTAVRSQQLQVQFLKQKASLQGLLEGYENGSIKLQDFVGDAQSARNSLGLLNDSDLRTLEGAIEGAKQKMQQLQEGSKATLATLSEELMGLRGEAEALERSKFAGRRADLQQQISEAQKAGDATALGNLQKAMGTLRQIEAETSQKRQQDEQQKRLAAAKPAETAQPAGPAKIIRLETSKGKTVDVAVNTSSDETNLLSILEDAGLRSL